MQGLSFLLKKAIGWPFSIKTAPMALPEKQSLTQMGRKILKGLGLELQSWPFLDARRLAETLFSCVLASSIAISGRIGMLSSSMF